MSQVLTLRSVRRAVLGRAHLAAIQEGLQDNGSDVGPWPVTSPRPRERGLLDASIALERAEQAAVRTRSRWLRYLIVLLVVSVAEGRNGRGFTTDCCSCEE